MNPITLREAILRAIGADPELHQMIACLPDAIPEPPPTQPLPAFLAQFAPPPRVALLDQIIAILHPHRPVPRVYTDPTPKPSVPFHLLIGVLPDDVDTDALAVAVEAGFMRGYSETGSVLAGAHLDGTLPRMLAAFAEEQPQDNSLAMPAPPTIWFHGSRSYSTDRLHPYCVTEEEDNILLAFLDRVVAMDTRDLADASGVTNVARLTKQLRQRLIRGSFASAIRTPNGAKCAGGYYIRVRSAG